MREAVAHLQASLGMSERRACRVVGADRKSVRYRSTRPDDADLRERLRALAAERRRFGYRRLHILLRRDGVLVNRKKTQRLYTEEGLTVRKRRSRRRAVGARAAPPVLALPNQRWSLDFVHDQMASGRRFRVLNIVDDVTREWHRTDLQRGAGLVQRGRDQLALHCPRQADAERVRRIVQRPDA